MKQSPWTRITKERREATDRFTSQPSIMSSLTLSVASLLSLVILVHGDCVIDPSMPCECTNPFLGTDNFFLGDATKNCNAAKACYVKNLSGCADARQSRGGNRCQSKLACKQLAPSTEKPTSSTRPITPEPTTPEPTSAEPTSAEPTSSEPTSSEPTSPEPTTSPKPTSDPIGEDPTTEAPALQPKCPGAQICSCISPSEECERCEVECQADCNDLKTDGTKCFSESACNPNLLFEIDNGLECPAPTGSTTEGAVVEPEDPEEGNVEEPASPKPKCPAEEIGGARICECLVPSPGCTKCEVDCQADCNDLVKEEGKCFSEYACQDLLFELDCEP